MTLDVDAPAAADTAAGAESTGRDRARIVADADAKRIASLRARAALAGVELHRLASGQWLAARWNLARLLDDNEVEQWLTRVEGGRP
jgi:hypothetical protein